MAMQRAALPAGYPETAVTIHDLAMLLIEQNKPAEAEPLFREALEISRATLPAKHPVIALHLNNLGSNLQQQNRFAEAEPLLRVNAGYWQHPGATLRRFIDNSGPAPLVGTFDTLLSSTVGGDLSVEFYSDNLTPGQEFSMIQMAPSACCGFSGTFENVSVSSNGTHRVVTRYDADAVKAVVPVCPSDFDGDGFVTGDDFDSFVDEFQAGKAAADFDSDGFVTGDDFDAYVEAFQLGC